MNTDSPIRLTIKLCLNYGFHSLIAQQMKYFFKGTFSKHQKIRGKIKSYQNY